MGGKLLPFDNRPWAKPLARAVIAVSIIASIAGAYYFYALEELHISEVVIILLLLLTIIPPNVAVIMKKSRDDGSSTVPSGAMNTRLHPR
jgi:uncharacterized membrane protein YhaH (DUF805 family)